MRIGVRRTGRRHRDRAGTRPMSIFRHLLPLVCSQALVLSCASRHEIAPSQSTPTNMPRWGFEFERHAAEQQRAAEQRATEPRTEPPATNPYAPIRSRTPDVYSWQSEKRAHCTSGPAERNPELEQRLEPSAASGVLAAFPEQTSDPRTRAQADSPELVVMRLRPALHHCFSRWLDDQVDAHGSVRLALELGCAGEVEAISAENQGINEGTLTCLFSTVAPARFAPPVGGHATVLVPVVFKNAAR